MKPGSQRLFLLHLAAIAVACPLSASALTFQGIQPGVSEKAFAERVLGPGKSSDDESKENPWFKYSLEPYDSVHVQYDGSIVRAIHFKFKTAIPMPQVLDSLGVTGAPAKTDERDNGLLVDLFPQQGLLAGYHAAGEHKLVQWLTFTEPKYLKIENLWIEHNKEYPGFFGRGLILHVDFEAVGLMNDPVSVDSWYAVVDPDKGHAMLKSKSPPYADEKEHAWCGKDFTPRRRIVTYQDFQLFMPYDQLFLPKGKHVVELKVSLKAKGAPTASVVQKLSMNITCHGNDARVLKTWLEHNVVQNEDKGSLVHLHFIVWDHKDTKCRAVLFIYAKNGMFPIKAYDWTNADGEFYARCYFTPDHKGSEYKDFKIFIPHREIRKPVSGEVDMVGQVIICDDENDLLAETYFNFTTY